MQRKLSEMDHLELYLKQLLRKLAKLSQLRKSSKISGTRTENSRFLKCFIIQTVLKCANHFIPTGTNLMKYI